MSEGEVMALNEIIKQQQEHMRKLDTRIKVLERAFSSAEDVLNSIDWNVTNSMVLDPVYADSLYEALEEARKK